MKQNLQICNVSFSGLFLASFLYLIIFSGSFSAKAATNCQRNLLVTGIANPCPSSTFIYKATAYSDAAYTWSVVGGTIIGSANNDSVKVSWANNMQSGYVRVDIAVGSTCTQAYTYTVKVPSVYVAADTNKKLCRNEYLYVSAGLSSSADSVNWKVTGGTYTYTNTSKSAIRIAWDSNATAGGFRVRYYDAGKCLRDTIYTRSYSLLAGPPAIRQGIRREYGCRQQSKTIYVHTQRPGLLYAWTDLQKPQLGIISKNAYYTIGNVTGNRYFRIKTTDSVTGCFNYDTIEVVFDDFSTIQVTGDTQACKNVLLNYDLSTYYKGSPSYIAKGGTIVRSGNQFVEVKWTRLGRDTLLISNGYCTREVRVSVHDTAFTLKGPKTACVGEWLEYTLSANPNEVFTLTGTPSSMVDGTPVYPKKNVIRVKIAAAGILNITASRQNANNCGIKQAVAKIVVNPKATAAFSYSQKCEDKVVYFKNTSTNGNTYIWHFGDGDTSHSAAPEHAYNKTGKYRVTLVAISDKGCADTLKDTVNFEYWVKPLTTFSYEQPDSNGNVYFTPTNFKLVEQQWDFGDGGSDNNLLANHYYKADGKYKVRLWGKSEHGCMGETTQEVEVVRKKSSGIVGTPIRGQLAVYPNPFQDKITVQIPLEIQNRSVIIKLTDLTGREIQKQQVVGAEKQHEISTQTLASGMYVLQLQCGSQVWQQRVVKVQE